MAYSSDLFITDNLELKKILQKCTYCNKVTNNGDNIISISELLLFSRPKHNCKTCIIVNILEDFSNADVGHWILVCIDYVLDNAVIYDPLNNLNNTTLKTIKLFCKSNRLHYHNFSFRTQQINSKSWGIHCIYMIHAWHPHFYSLKFLIYDLKHMFKKCSLKTIENHILKTVIKHLK